MEPISAADFAKNAEAVFDEADTGMPVFIRRGDKLYSLQKLSVQELRFSPELQKRIDEIKNRLHDPLNP